jgi:hypothetical protein
VAACVAWHPAARWQRSSAVCLSTLTLVCFGPEHAPPGSQPGGFIYADRHSGGH